MSHLDLDAALARLGYSAFRPGQREAIETLLAAGRLLLVAPTGGGKSLTYQLPALLLPGTSVVISPLIALMHDQAQALERRGVAVTFLSSTLEGGELRRRMARIAAGAFKLVYVAPERLAFPGFRGLLRDIEVPLIAVDEAHCISEWGHDFRPDYLQIGELLADLEPPHVLACTATATPVVRDEILARLDLPADTPQLLRGFARPNLILRAAEVSGSRERSDRVDELLAESLGRPGAGRGTAIVYAPTRLRAEEEAERLVDRGWRSEAYHAGLSPKQRDKVQRAFAAGELEIIAATIAFGMGIDRPDVRAVVHLAAPASIEAYYQEVGRAGRDGQPAWGLVLVAPNDLPLRRSLLERTEGITPPILEHKWNLFLELMRWVEGGSCRHDAILRYFGDEAETLAGCGHCDVCAALASGGGDEDEETVSLTVRKALSGVARVHQRFGLKAAVQLLRGAPDPRLERSGLARTTTYGVLADRDDGWVTKLLRRCVTAGWVDFTTGDRPLVFLTDTGRLVMQGKAPARLLLPASAPAPFSGRKRSRAARPVPRDIVAGSPPRHVGPRLQPGAVAAPAGDKRQRPGGRRRPRLIPITGDRFLIPEDATQPPDHATTRPQDDALFVALRQHRLEIARRENVPPYVVASDRTLRDLAAVRPRSVEDLEGIFGIGPARAARYGQGFLDVIARAAHL